MISVLLNASITGGVIILLWYLSEPLSKKYFKASWHYFILKATMVFMLLPISLFAPTFNNILTGLFAKPDLPYISEQMQIININAETISSVNSALTDIVFSNANQSPSMTPQLSQTGNVTHPDIKTVSPSVPYLQIIWLTGAIILFVGETRKMHKFKKQIINSSHDNADRETLELFLQCKEQLKIRSKINLRISKYIKTPLAFGLIRPFVIFPETDMSTDEKRLAFIHEITHIKNGDLYIKYFAFVISAIHWFNPFTHLLRRKISVISEEYCDECVVKTMTKEERLIYGRLILKVVSDIAATHSKFCSTLSTPTKNIKRRLFSMMNTKKSHKSMVALSVIAAFILCSFATIYAFSSNAITPENLTPEPADITEKDVNDNGFNRFWGTLGIGYIDDKGDEAFRISNDGGVTWYTEEEFDKINPVPDTDLSAIEWLTYDEFRDWVDKKKVELQEAVGTTYYKYIGDTVDDCIETGPFEWTQEEIDEQIADWESLLEDLKDFSGEVGIIDINGFERVFFFSMHESANGGEVMVQDDSSVVTIYDDETETWKEYDSHEEFYSTVIANDQITSVVVYKSETWQEYSAIEDVRLECYGYRYTPDNGENMGFGADTYEHLYELVKNYFDEQIQAGNITQEEANRNLAEMTKESTHIFLDADGNFIK